MRFRNRGVWPSFFGHSQTVAQAAEHDQRTADYLIGTPLLADYLESGLDCFGESCMAFEMAGSDYVGENTRMQCSPVGV